MDNIFKITIPAEIQKGENGSYKIAGLASTESFDKQGEKIMQKGIELSPIDEGRGFLNFDHSNKPEDLIGTLDGYKKDSNGLFIQGTLFKGHQRAEAIKAIMEGLKEKPNGAIGLSVEGAILERDPVNPKIIKKCEIKNVAVTFNPVNTDTYAKLVKSMESANLEFNATKENLHLDSENDQFEGEEATFTATQIVEIVQKALSLSPNQADAPNTLSDGDAMQVSDKSEKKKKKPSKLKKLSKEMYKSQMTLILNQLQELYPDVSRGDLWDSVKNRLETRFPDISEIDIINQ